MEKDIIDSTINIEQLEDIRGDVISTGRDIKDGVDVDSVGPLAFVLREHLKEYYNGKDVEQEKEYACGI